MQTRKVSCQYPIFEIEDLSPSHPENTNNNTWHVDMEYPGLYTMEEIKEDPDLPKFYIARAWARPNEELKFHVKFGDGSHMRITWKITVPEENDECKTNKGAEAPAELKGGVSFNGLKKKACTFPFRYGGVLYYGCTMNIPEGKICAIETDSDYNAKVIGECNDYCHVQCKTSSKTSFVLYTKIKKISFQLKVFLFFFLRRPKTRRFVW